MWDRVPTALMCWVLLVGRFSGEKLVLGGPVGVLP